MINRLIDTGQPVEVQESSFTTDVMGRYICGTWDKAVNNGGVMFDAVVIGAGMFGAYCAEKIYRNANLRVLVLEAGSFLVSEHVQNLARIGLNVGQLSRSLRTIKTLVPGTMCGAHPGEAKWDFQAWRIAWVDDPSTGEVGRLG